jgi:hypothetical protein
MLKDITLRFWSDTPSLPSVIPSMDAIDSSPTTAISTRKYNDAITAALKLGKGLLNKYYSLTDKSAVYRIAMGLFYYSSPPLGSTNDMCSAPSIIQAAVL